MHEDAHDSSPGSGGRAPSATLDGMTTAVFAATGAIGSGTARVLAGYGAHVVVSGRDGGRAKELANDIQGRGGRATAAAVDATDPREVDAHLAEIIATRGRLDGVFNAIGLPPRELGYPARSADVDADIFLRPVRTILWSTFLTARSGAQVMAEHGGGAVVTLSASLTGGAFANMAALTATCGAIEAMTRSLSGEFGPRGVRINCVRGDAMPETPTIQQTAVGQAALAGVALPDFDMGPPGPLGRPITVEETARAVAFMLSPAASGITSQTLTVSGTPMVGG